MQKTIQLLLFTLLIVAGTLPFAGCNEAPGGPIGPTRGYRLGFTPFPYDVSTTAVDYVYGKLRSDGDLIAHHLDDGIPWPEALAGEPYSQSLQNEWATRKGNTPAGHKVYLAITPINLARTGLALYRGSEPDMPLPFPWYDFDFNHPNVTQAFINHVVRAVEYFQPDYLSIGIEANVLLTNSPEKWNAYLELHKNAYLELKQRYPNLPIFVSLFSAALLEGWRQEDDHAAQMAALEEVAPYTDYYAISLYPFISKYLTDDFPATMWDDLFGLMNKPIAIAETGYPADTLELPNTGVTFRSTPEKQEAFIGALIHEADKRDMRFIVNFILRDYDALWEAIGRPETGGLWRDTGLYDEKGNPRPAYNQWRTALLIPYAPAP